MYIAVVDDLAQERETLKGQIREYAIIHGQELSVRAFPTAESFLADFRPNLYVAVFMDIYLGSMTGIDAALELRKTDNQVSLVFLTSSPDHMPDAFRCHAYDYLLKPTDRERVFAVLDGILRLRTEVCDRLAIRWEGRDYCLAFPDIMSVVARGHYTEIKTQDGKTFVPLMAFSAVQGSLAHDPRFITLVRGVLVNLDYVVAIQDGQCRLSDRSTLPVNVRSQHLLASLWETYKFNRVRSGGNL